MFRQSAFGEFTVAVTGPNHCGPNHDSPKRFNFEVHLTYPDWALDHNGFLLDNTSFQHYFDGLISINESCEQLCHRVAEELCRLAGVRAKSCNAAVWAIPNAAKIEYQLKRSSLALMLNKIRGLRRK